MKAALVMAFMFGLVVGSAVTNSYPDGVLIGVGASFLTYALAKVMFKRPLGKKG